jgi:hypothetical protein
MWVSWPYVKIKNIYYFNNYDYTDIKILYFLLNYLVDVALFFILFFFYIFFFEMLI